MSGYNDFMLPADEKVVLPSGMGSDPQYPVALRYPTMRYFLHVASLPGRLPAMVSSPMSEDQPPIPPDSPDANVPSVENTDIDNTDILLCDVFVTPVISLEPKPGEFHPSRLSIEDRTFVLQWATDKLNSVKRGRSNDLENFRKKPQPDEVVTSSR